MAFVVQIAVSFDLNPGYLLHKPAVLRKSFPAEIANKEKNSVAVVVEMVVSVDLGFIVFNELTYPNLLNFFKELNVPYEKSNMSFAVSVKGSNIEYGGKGLKALFANRSNFLNLSFLKMIVNYLFF